MNRTRTLLHSFQLHQRLHTCPQISEGSWELLLNRPPGVWLPSSLCRSLNIACSYIPIAWGTFITSCLISLLLTLPEPEVGALLFNYHLLLGCTLLHHLEKISSLLTSTSTNGLRQDSEPKTSHFIIRFCPLQNAATQDTAIIAMLITSICMPLHSLQSTDISKRGQFNCMAYDLCCQLYHIFPS